MPSIDALIRALQQYEGTLLFVSHDVHFIRALATTVLHIHAGNLTPYAGDYGYYLEKSQATSERGALVAKLHNYQPDSPAAAPEPAAPKMGMKEIRALRKAESERRQAENKERRNQLKRIAELEASIVELESKQTELTEKLDDPSLYQNPSRALELNRELAGVADSLAKANTEWAYLAEKVPKESETAEA
jgi:ATP-binding cassette subfamily F protein 3